jgi:hypothetical protein
LAWSLNLMNDRPSDFRRDRHADLRFADGRRQLAVYLASLPRSSTGLSSGSLWVSAASNQLNFVP